MKCLSHELKSPRHEQVLLQTTKVVCIQREVCLRGECLLIELYTPDFRSPHTHSTRAQLLRMTRMLPLLGEIHVLFAASIFFKKAQGV